MTTKRGRKGRFPGEEQAVGTVKKVQVPFPGFEQVWVLILCTVGTEIRSIQKSPFSSKKSGLGAGVGVVVSVGRKGEIPKEFPLWVPQIPNFFFRDPSSPCMEPAQSLHGTAAF